MGKRMFNLSVVNTDGFLLDLTLSAQALYFHLSMRADDDGFVENPRVIRRMTGATEEDFLALVNHGYLIAFDGPVVITHWLLHNTITADRKKGTIFQDELRKLKVVNFVYQIRGEDDPEEPEKTEEPDPEKDRTENPEEETKAAEPEEKNTSGNSKEQPANSLQTSCTQSANSLQATCLQLASNLLATCKQDANKMRPQNRLDIKENRPDKDQVSIGQHRSGQDSKAEERGDARAGAREAPVDNSVDKFGISKRPGQGQRKPELKDLPPESREAVLRFQAKLQEKRGSA